MKTLTIFDYFKENISDDIFYYEIDTNIKKNTNEIYNFVIEASKNNYFVQNSKVLILLPNSIEFIEYMLCAIKNNCVFIPVPFFMIDQEVLKVIDYIKPDIIITDRVTLFENYKLNFFNSSNDKKIFYNKKKPLEDLTNICSIYYSSGTTSNPKGVMYTNENMISLIQSINNNFKFDRNDKHLVLLPFGHTASINYNILPAILGGFELYITRGFENIRSNFFDIVSKYNITYSQIVPTVLFMLNKLNINTSNASMSHLKFIGCGSSNLPLTSQVEFIEKYNVKVANLYGLSETGPSHIDDPREINWTPGSIGIPLDVNECKIGLGGEIMLKGKNVFSNYYKNEKLYNKSIENGWFKTGDIGKFEYNKYWYVDRSKDLIIKGGINIVPMEIEEVIYKHDNVLECCVVGKKNKIVGEEIIAVIVLKNIENNDLQTINKICKKYLSNYKQPKDYHFVNELPKTQSKKIMRRKVREMFGG